MNSTLTRARAGARAAGVGLALLLALVPVLPATAAQSPAPGAQSPAPGAESPAPGAESAAAPETGKGRTVIGDGHIDMGPRFDHGVWTVQIRDDTTRPAIWRETTDVVLRVDDAAKVEVPGGAEFGFLGEPGDEVWLLPQVQQDGVLWPGWNSQEPEVAATVDREVNWQLTSVTGPGDFVLFLNGSFGTPKILFDGRAKLPQETGIEVNSHVHGNWAFTKPGTYLLGVRMTARTKDGKSHDSERTLRFSVGPQDPRKAFDAEPPTGAPAAPSTGAAPAPGPAPGADTGSAAAEQVSTSGSASPLWWGAGAAAVVAAVAGTLMWRRGRNKEQPALPATEDASPPEGQDQ